MPATSASAPRGAESTAYRGCVDPLLYASLSVEWTHHSHHCGVRNEASPEFLVPVPDELGIFAIKVPMVHRPCGSGVSVCEIQLSAWNRQVDS
jgi:hypothetical protein